MKSIKDMVYRIKDGNAVILWKDGGAVTRIDANVYPIGSNLSARYEHAAGIILTISDAESIGIHEER